MRQLPPLLMLLAAVAPTASVFVFLQTLAPAFGFLQFALAVMNPQPANRNVTLLVIFMKRKNKEAKADGQTKWHSQVMCPAEFHGQPANICFLQPALITKWRVGVCALIF